MARSWFFGDGLDLGPPPYDTRAHRSSRGGRREDLLLRPPPVQQASFISDGKTYDIAGELDEKIYEKVTLIGSWGCNGENFSPALIGRVVHRDELNSESVHVWFKRRGVFSFPATAVRKLTLQRGDRESLYPHQRPRRRGYY